MPNHPAPSDSRPIPPALEKYITPEAPIAKANRISKEELKELINTSQAKVTHGHKSATETTPSSEKHTTQVHHKHDTTEVAHSGKTLKPDWTQSQVTDTTQYPYSCVGIVLISVTDSNGRTTSNTYCTGVLVGKNLMLTIGSALPWNQNCRIAFIPGYNNGSAPFGTANVLQWYGYDVPSNQVQQNYAVCQLDRDIGYRTNWMGTAAFASDSTYSNANWNSVGYSSGDVQITATDININNVQDWSGSTQLDTGEFASGGWAGGPMWNLGNNIFDLSVNLDPGTAYCVAVWGGYNSTGGFLGIGNTTYDANVGGDDMVYLVIYGINNWS